MARMNANRQKLLFLIMRHAGGFIIKNTANDNREIRVDDATAANLIGLDLDGQQNRDAFQINGFDKTTGADLADPININLHHNTNGTLNIPNVGAGNNGNNNPDRQLAYINWLLSKIDVSCMDKDTLQRLHNAGFIVTENRDNNQYATGLQIRVEAPVTTANIDTRLKRLFLALPDLQYEHRNQLTTDPLLSIEVSEKRANFHCDFTNTNTVTVDNAVNIKIKASVTYGGINNFLNSSKEAEDPHLQINITDAGGELNAGNAEAEAFGLTEIQMHDGIVDTRIGDDGSHYMTRSKINIIQALDSTNNDEHNNYHTQITRDNLHQHPQWVNYANNDQNCAFNKEFREYMLKTFGPVLATKTLREQNEFKRRLSRKVNDPAILQDSVPLATFDKTNINYVLESLGDLRLQLKSDVPNDLGGNENNAKNHIASLTSVINEIETFASRDLIRRKFTNPASKEEVSLFKLYTQDLSGEESITQERNHFFGKRLSTNPDQGGLIYHPNNNRDGIIENFKVYQRDINDNNGLKEITIRDNDRLPENARPSVVKTSMEFRVPIENANYDPTAGADDNDPNRHHHKLKIDRYHQSHDDHQKNEYDIYLIDHAGNRVRNTNKLDLEHFLKIARTVSAKHNVVDLTQIPKKEVNITLPEVSDWGIINTTIGGTNRHPYYPIPAQWVMYAAFKAKNFQGELRIVPSSLTELQRTNGCLADKIQTLINHISGNDPENVARLNLRF